MDTTAYAAPVSFPFAYPTPAHERAASAITEFFASRDEIDAVLLVNSCARGKATAVSCLDMQAIVPPGVVERADPRIPWFLDRDLYFQAFDRFYRAFQGFLLGLHVSRRIYPIAYNKWIREQIAENLGLPQLYDQLPRLFEFDRFESRALEAKAQDLRQLVDEYVVP